MAEGSEVGQDSSHKRRSDLASLHCVFVTKLSVLFNNNIKSNLFQIQKRELMYIVFLVHFTLFLENHVENEIFENGNNPKSPNYRRQNLS